MKIIFTILVFAVINGHAQPPKCVQPTIAGTANTALTLPNNSFIASFTATGNNGHPSISNFNIGQDSGYTVTVVSPNQNVSQITGFSQAGVYKFHETAIDSCGAKAVYYFYVTVLAQPIVAYTLKIVPNPAHHNFTATVSGNGSGKVTLSVYSPTAKLLQSASGNKPLNSAYSKLFYTYFYKAGNYVVTASINGTNISQTLIIQ